MRRTRGKRGTLALAAALVALAAAGCGGDDSEAPEALEGTAAEEALVAGAEAANDNTESIDARIGGSITTPAEEQEFTFDGLVDPVSETGTFEVGVGDGTFELVLVEDGAYITSDDSAFTDALPEGAEWIELTLEELNSAGIDTGFSEGAFSPQLYLVLGATDVVAGDAEEVGDDPVRSYSFTIDEAKAVAEAPPELKTAVEDAIKLEGENPMIEGGATLDAEGRMRSFGAIGTVESPDGGGIEVGIETEYRAFGVDVPADPPSEDVTVPFSEAPEALAVLQSLLAG